MNGIQKIIPGSDGARILNGIGLIGISMGKAVGGLALGVLSAQTSVIGIGIAGIPAAATLMTSSYSDFEQGWNVIALGLKGDSLTPTTNSMSELLYDGNDAVYHFSTNAASAIATTGLSLVKTSNPAVTGEANNIAERAAMQADDVIEGGMDAPKTIPQALTRDGQVPVIGKMKDLNTPGNVV